MNQARVEYLENIVRRAIENEELLYIVRYGVRSIPELDLSRMEASYLEKRIEQACIIRGLLEPKQLVPEGGYPE